MPVKMATKVSDFHGKKAKFDTAFYYKLVTWVKKMGKKQKKFFEVNHYIKGQNGPF